jgi:hypothetical protein
LSSVGGQSVRLARWWSSRRRRSALMVRVMNAYQIQRRSRFPAGMTERKASAKATADSRPAGMTERKAKAAKY